MCVVGPFTVRHRAIRAHIYRTSISCSNVCDDNVEHGDSERFFFSFFSRRKNFDSSTWKIVRSQSTCWFPFASLLFYCRFVDRAEIALAPIECGIRIESEKQRIVNRLFIFVDSVCLVPSTLFMIVCLFWENASTKSHPILSMHAL